MFAYPPGTMEVIDGIELNSIALRQALEGYKQAGRELLRRYTKSNMRFFKTAILLPGRLFGWRGLINSFCGQYSLIMWPTI